MARGTHAGAFRIRAAAALSGVYGAVVLLVTLWPTTVDRDLDPYLDRVLTALHARGVPSFIDYAFVEFCANVLFFVPVGFLLAILLDRRRQWLAVAFGFLLSTGVEAAQWTFLPGRVASAGDVLANTSGAALGCAVAVLVRAVIRYRDTLVARDRVEAGRGGGRAATVTAPGPAPGR